MTQTGQVRRPRWYQFRLRTLFAGVTATALVLVAYRIYIEPYRAQRQTIELIEQLGGRFETSGPTPWQRRLLGPDHQNLVRVDLADVETPDSYLPRIARLPKLETLIVGGQAFGDEHLERLAGLTTLRELVLDSTSVSPEALANWRERFPSLEILRSQRMAVRWLKLEDTLRMSTQAVSPFVGDQHLLEIHDWGSLLLSPDICRWLITCVPTLESLDLFGAQVGDDALTHLGQMHALVRLNLSRTRVSDGVLASCATLQRLREANLSGSNISDVGVAHLARLTNLTSLDLSNTRVTDGATEYLTALPNLEKLILSGTLLTDAAVRELKGAPMLREVDVGYTKATDACLENLGRMTRLRRLGLAGTAISDAGLLRLLDLKELDFLDVRRTAVTTTGLVSLAELDKVTVTHDENTEITNQGLKLLRKLGYGRPRAAP